MLPSRWLGGWLGSTVLMAASISPLRGAEAPPGTIQENFESARPAWHQEETDATIRLIAHERSDRAAHEGRFSERFQFESGPGSAFYCSYSLPKIPVTDALHASLYVRSNRAGVQLFGRVVLPGDIDPDTGQPSFVLVPGPIYENSERWQKLELIDLRQSVERQTRVLRASTRRPVALDGAYLDRLVVNLYGGPGESEVFVDELSVAPVPAELIAAHNAPPLPSPTAPSRTQAPAPETRRNPTVRLDRNRLRRDNYDWFFTAIHAPGADVAKLRRAGFDVLAEDIDADPKRIQDAIAKGFLLMPILSAKAGSDEPPDPSQLVSTVAAYPYRDSVAFWYLGDHLGRARDTKAREAELERVQKTVSGFHGLPKSRSRLTTATVDGDLLKFARPPRNLALIGVRPSPWGSMQEPIDTYSYLTQRRLLGARWNAGGLYWTWIPATPPRVVLDAIWGEGVSPPAWGVPLVQPEQLRMYTYIALAAGYRGIGYQAGADLTRGNGQALLIEMALLNEELDLLESILANGADPIPFYHSYPPDPPTLPPPGGLGSRQRVPGAPEMAPLPDVRAAAIGTLDRKGVLLLVTNIATYSQYQPPQMAARDLQITVIVPEGAQACEISPGGIRWLERKRVPGGTRISIPDFGVTAIILITTDVTFVEQIEANLARVRPKAVALAIDQAEWQLGWVTDINNRLIALGHPLKVIGPKAKKGRIAPEPPKTEDEVADLLKLAEESIKDARAARDREDYLTAWTEARRACRPLRILMRAHFDQAFGALTNYVIGEPDDEVDEPRARTEAEQEARQKAKKKKREGFLVVPTSSPACVAFNTLPQHYHLLDWLKGQSFGSNLVPSGSFDDPEELEESGWTNQSYQHIGITSKVVTEARGTDQQRPAIKMKVEPADPKGLDALPPFLDFPAAAIRSPAIPIGAEYLYRISVKVKRPRPGVSGVGGVIVRDSIGGEPLQFRWTGALPEWTKVVLFRRAPSDGELTVTLGLAGYGAVYFDDFKVERVEEPPKPLPPNVAGRPRRRPSAPATATRPTPRERLSQ